MKDAVTERGEGRTTALTVPADRFYLSTVRAYVGEIARTMGFSEGDIDSIVLASAEAAANVIEHAFFPEENATFDVLCEVTSRWLKVIIRDKGLPFSPDRIKKFSVDDVVRGKAPSGLGFFLMEKSVDRFSFHNKGFEGKEIHLIKHIHKKRIEDYFEESKLSAYEKPTKECGSPGESIPYHVKLMEPSQAIEISQCAYRTYGYHYIFEYLYYPERIVEMNRRGELVSAVAVADATGEVMGHAALELDDERGLVELGVAFTKPQFRRQGCFNRLAEYLLDRARERGNTGVYARAVTIHPFSQRAILRQGFRDCGILIGLAPATLFQKSERRIRQRESVVMLFYHISRPSPVTLFVAGHHREMAEKIYRNISVPVRLADPGGAPADLSGEKNSIVETTVNTSLMCAKISVKRYGSAILDEVSHTVRMLKKQKVDLIHLSLDLCDPLTACLTGDFESMGFFFAGVLPSDTRHNLVLQYLNDVAIDYDGISAESDFAKELLFYIRSSDPNVS